MNRSVFEYLKWKRVWKGFKGKVGEEWFFGIFSKSEVIKPVVKWFLKVNSIVVELREIWVDFKSNSFEYSLHSIIVRIHLFYEYIWQMFIKMNSFIIFFFFFASIQCYDWCLLIAPDGNYRELGITRHWKGYEKTDVELVMYNKVGDEWLFRFPPSISQNATIQIVDGSVRPGPPSDVINRFAIYITSSISSGLEIGANFQLLNKVWMDFMKPTIDWNLISVEWHSIGIYDNQKR